MHQCEVGWFESFLRHIFLGSPPPCFILFFFFFPPFLFFLYSLFFLGTVQVFKMEGIYDDYEGYICMYVCMYVCSISTYINEEMIICSIAEGSATRRKTKSNGERDRDGKERIIRAFFLFLCL